jgi:hypothetical protein
MMPYVTVYLVLKQNIIAGSHMLSSLYEPAVGRQSENAGRGEPGRLQAHTVTRQPIGISPDDAIPTPAVVPRTLKE